MFRNHLAFWNSEIELYSSLRPELQMPGDTLEPAAYVQILVLLLLSCVTLDKFLNLSVP